MKPKKYFDRLRLLAIVLFMLLLSSLLTVNVSASVYCGTSTTVTLWAGQNMDAGTVEIGNDGTNLYVTFSTTGNWLIAETHVHVATSMEDIPQRNGNPIPGQFDYKTNHDPAVNTFTYTIPLIWDAGTDLVIAAHAALILVDDNGNVIGGETGWGDGPDFPGRNWATYIEYTVQSCNQDPGEGCTLTQGYWRTHSKYGPAPYDQNWASIGEDTAFFSSGETWYSALWVSPQGDAYYILAQQYIAAVLNQNNGADTFPVTEEITRATTWFQTYSPGVYSGDDGHAEAIRLGAVLDAYNNGYTGPGHCG